DGVRIAHFGDFGQPELRPEQARALEGIDLLFVPVGAGPTIGPKEAAAIVDKLSPRWVVPMHYRTPKIGFLETEEEFLDQMKSVERRPESGFDTRDLPDGDRTGGAAPPRGPPAMATAGSRCFPPCPDVRRRRALFPACARSGSRRSRQSCRRSGAATTRYREHARRRARSACRGPRPPT